MDKLSLFWYSLENFKKKPKFNERRFFTKYMRKAKENYGDLVSKFLVENISKKKTKWYNPSTRLKKNFFVIGSILNYSNESSIIWGSGIIQQKDLINATDFRAVRGPLTRKRVMELGKECPEIYGDPAILLPEIFKPKVSKKYILGIIPHYVDFKQVTEMFGENKKIKIINLLTSNIKTTTKEIMECENIISSSLHGMIVAHSYGISSIWVKFGNRLYGDNVKFDDYLLSMRLKPYQEMLIDKNISEEKFMSLFENKDILPKRDILLKRKKGLINSMPFECKNEQLLNLAK